jgi:hypothetical protein
MQYTYALLKNLWEQEMYLFNVGIFTNSIKKISSTEITKINY